MQVHAKAMPMENTEKYYRCNPVGDRKYALGVLGRPTHPVEQAEVRCDRADERFVGCVTHAELAASLFDHLR